MGRDFEKGANCFCEARFSVRLGLLEGEWFQSGQTEWAASRFGGMQVPKPILLVNVRRNEPVAVGTDGNRNGSPLGDRSLAGRSRLKQSDGKRVLVIVIGGRRLRCSRSMDEALVPTSVGTEPAARPH
jgi:hypothetical protein